MTGCMGGLRLCTQTACVPCTIPLVHPGALPEGKEGHQSLDLLLLMFSQLSVSAAQEPYLGYIF